MRSWVVATYRDEVPDTCPETVVWQLPPAAGVVHIAVVEDAAGKVNDDGDDNDDGEDTTGAHAAGLVRLHAGTSMLRAHHKQVGALVRVGADKGDGGCRTDGVAVAPKSKGGRLSASVIFLDRHSIERAGVALAGTAEGRRGAGGGGGIFVVDVGLVRCTLVYRSPGGFL